MASPVRGERYEERKRTHSVERDRAKGDDRYAKRSRVRSRSRERRGDDRPDKRGERRNGVGDDFDRPHLDRRERDRDRERDKDRYRDGRDFRRDRDRDRDHSYRDRDKPRERDSRDQDRDGDKVRGSNKSRDKQREAPNDEKDKQGDVKTENGGGTGQGTDPPTEEPEKVENGQDKTHKAEPLSLEELLKKKKEQQEAEAKPRFMSKKERETLALQRRELEAAIQKARLEEARNEQAARDVNERMERIKCEEERKAQEEERKKWQEEREREKELAMIKQQYLGGEKVKKRVMKPSEKFRFNFDWEASDDTSRDLNPLYNNLHEAQLLFGRGLRAGIDRREQKKAAAQYEQQVMRKLRSAAGIAETTETRRQERERARLADKYDGFDMKTDRHWSDKVLEDMTERDWRIFREDFNISYKGVNPALPLRRWEEAEVPESIHKAIKRCGYDKPSPIQMAAIPIGLQQRDVIGIAETGSGKTAAFVIPMLVYIMKQPPMTELNEADGPYAVIMAPTRELAQQIEEETIKLAYYTNFRTTSVVGGQSIEEQGAKLRRGCEIVVATPGRLIDCLERRYAVLNQCNYVVLDEADRMIDMGFEPQVIGVLDAMPSSNLKPENEDTELESDRVYRTTYMFSATMPPAVERLARKYLRRPIVINIGSAGRATDNVTQRVLMMKENEKPQRLSSEMDLIDEKRAIVFVNTKKQCDSVYRHLEDLGYRCTVLHGGKTQEQREHGIKGFREDTYNILIATDVAGRGIDVPGVALVVNYDMPNNIEAYTHRIGRTGRAGKKGVAISFVTMGDTEIFYDLKRVLEDSKAMVPPELARHEAAKMKPGSFEAKPKRAETLFAH